MSRCCRPSASGFTTVSLYLTAVTSQSTWLTSIAGKFVSESKFSARPSDFIPHIQRPNRGALEGLITKPEVERSLLQRLRKKATTYAQDFAPEGEASKGTAKIDVEGVVDIYESFIIPLTKEIEVDYLLRRLDGLSQSEIDELAKR